MKTPSRNDQDCYQGYLWEEPDKNPEVKKESPPPEQPSRSLFEEGSRNLLSVAKEICPLYPASRNGPYKVSFYGYTSLKSTIREQKSGVAIRVSHLLLDAPREVLAGVLHTLLARFHGRPIPKECCKAYDDFCRRPEIEERMRHLRKVRGKKILVGTRGDVRSLDEVFERVNRVYFEGKLAKPTMTWSPGVSRRIMGYYDHGFHTIVISSGLDSKRVPTYVLDYIMYHELLHIVCPIRSRGRRREIHTAEFKRREREFSHYHRAVRWIKKNWR